MTKSTKWHLCAAKTQISLGIRPVWSESSLCTKSVAKDQSFLHADSEDSDQTWQMARLIWVFAGRTCHFVGFVMRRLILCGFVVSTTRRFMLSLTLLLRLMFSSPVYRCDHLAWGKESWSVCFSCIFSFFLHALLSVLFSSSWCQGFASTCDRGTSWNFHLIFGS